MGDSSTMTPSHEQPDGRLHEQLAGIWADTLALDEVGPDENFYDLGGYSLIAAKIAGRVQEVFGVGLPASAVLSHPTVAELAREIVAHRSAPEAHRIERHGGDTHPLSLIQEEVWFHHRLAPEIVAYNTQWSLRVRGPLDIDVFERAVTVLTARHEMLRTVFGETEDGQPWQRVLDPEPAHVKRHDLTGFPAEERQEIVERIAAQETARAFDLSRLPLFRWSVITLAPEEYELLVVEHHFVHDGWSFTVHTRELAEIYGALLAGREPQLPELPVHYADFARWQRAAVENGELDAQRRYWHGQLAGSPVLSLPTDRPRPKHQRFRGGELRLDVSAETANGLRALCRESGATLYMGMLSAFAIWLLRRTGERDFCVGAGFANRRRQTEDLIGMFVNTVVLRCRPTPEASFREVLAGVRSAVLEAAEHHDYPFVRLVQELRPERDLSFNPLFQVMFSFHDTPARPLDFGGSPATIVERANGTAKADLNIVAIPRAERLQGRRDEHGDAVTVYWEYNSDLFDADTARRMTEQYALLLSAAVADPDAPVWGLGMVGAAERELLELYSRGAG